MGRRDPHHDGRHANRRRPQPGTHVVAAGTAEIIRDLDLADGWMLVIDGIPSSYVDLADPTHLEFEYVQWIGHLLDLAGPVGAPLDVLHLGGGACTLARYVAASRPGSRQLVAEHDAALVDLVRREFNLRFRIRTEDARDVVAGRRDASADVVVRDAFAGPAIPPHLTTVEFVRDVARVLRIDGCYLANVTDGPPLRRARAEAATLRTVFPHVSVVAETPVLHGRRYGNLVLAASASPLPVVDLARLLARATAPTRVLEAGAMTRFVSGAKPLGDTDTLGTAAAGPPATPGGWGVGSAGQG